MTEQPTLAEKIARITDPAELPGFQEQLEIDGRLDTQTQQMIALRRAELSKRK